MLKVRKKVQYWSNAVQGWEKMERKDILKINALTENKSSVIYISIKVHLVIIPVTLICSIYNLFL